jgi:DNA-directed RNA polymerase specialized sigma24 family protein
MLKAFIHPRKFRFEASFRAWLIRICLNEARQWQRKCASSRLATLDLPTLPQLPAGYASASLLVGCQRSEAIVRPRTAIARRPERYRIVVPPRDLEDISISEVARPWG